MRLQPATSAPLAWGAARLEVSSSPAAASIWRRLCAGSGATDAVLNLDEASSLSSAGESAPLASSSWGRGGDPHLPLDAPALVHRDGVGAAVEAVADKRLDAVSRTLILADVFILVAGGGRQLVHSALARLCTRRSQFDEVRVAVGIIEYLGQTQ